jgi:hypothetical protein
MVPQQPILGYATGSATRAATPVLVAGEPKIDSADLSRFAAGLAPGPAEIRRAMRGNMRSTTDALFELLTAAPLMSCAGRQGAAANEAALCKLLQHGQGPAAPCCIDFTGPAAGGAGLNSWQAGRFTGRLQRGLNYWSLNPAHNEANYSAILSVCLVGTTAVDNTTARGQCNAQVMRQWAKEGARFGSGFGAVSSVELLQSLTSSLSTDNSGNGGISVASLIQFGITEQFRCVVPEYGPGMDSQLPANQCINLHEGLARLAAAVPFPAGLLPNPEPVRGIPNCTLRGNCLFDGVPGKSTTLPGAGGGRWAQSCDFHTLGWAKTVSSLVQAGDVAGLIGYLQSLPCICIWLAIAPQVRIRRITHYSPTEKRGNTTFLDF